MQRFSPEESAKRWGILKARLAPYELEGYASYYLARFEPESTGILDEAVTPFPFAETLQLKYDQKSFNPDMLLNDGIVAHLAARQANVILLCNAMTLTDLVDFNGDNNSQRDILMVSPYELKNARFGKHYLPEFMLTDEAITWAACLDSEDAFHVFGPEAFVKEFTAAIRKFIQPYQTGSIKY